MNAREPIYDVILTYAASEVAWAIDVERRLADAGVNAFRIVSPEPGETIDDTWQAHAESHALILLISPGAEPPLMMFEAGAAMMGQKPVYVLYKGPRPAKLPRYIEQFGVFPAAEVEKVVTLVAEASQPLSEREQQILATNYESMDTSIKDILRDRDKARQLARRVSQAAGSSLSKERVLRELIRLGRQRRGRLLQKLPA